MRAGYLGGATPNVGEYRLRLPIVSLANVIGMVTAYGSSGEYCDQLQLGTNGRKAKYLDDLILCFNEHGERHNMEFSGTIMTAH